MLHTKPIVYVLFMVYLTTLSISETVASNEVIIGRDLGGSDRDLSLVLSRHSEEGLKKVVRNISQISR